MVDVKVADIYQFYSYEHEVFIESSLSGICCDCFSKTEYDSSLPYERVVMPVLGWFDSNFENLFYMCSHVPNMF